MQQILVVDDEDDLRNVMTVILKDVGYEVIPLESGEQALEYLKAAVPDLIVCDISMRNLSGYDVLKVVRENPSTSQIPFIFVSGVSDRAGIRRGMELGADDYILKPFASQELVAAVSTRLKKYGDSARSSERKLEQLRENITLALPHEFRTPLTSILGYSKLLSDDQAQFTADEINKMGAAIHSGGERLLRLLEKYLTYAQIEVIAADETRVRSLRLNRTSDVEKAIQTIAHIKSGEFARTNDITLKLENATLAISPDSFVTIVQELLDNALKFSAKGTAVLVECTCMPETVTISFHDHGRGMTTEQIANIGAYMQFKRKFYEQQGYGLGLIIAKRMADLYGGGFQITSTEGVGTSVQVILPRVQS